MILTAVQEQDDYAGRLRGNSGSNLDISKQEEHDQEIRQEGIAQRKHKKSRSVINVTDSATGAKVMKKKMAQTERGLAGCRQMKTLNYSLLRSQDFHPLLSINVP